MTALQGPKEISIYVSPPNEEKSKVNPNEINGKFRKFFQQFIQLKEEEQKKPRKQRDVEAIERHLEVMKEGISCAFPFKKEEVGFLIRTYLPFTSLEEDKPLC